LKSVHTERSIRIKCNAKIIGNQHLNSYLLMKNYSWIALFVLLISCNPNGGNQNNEVKTNLQSEMGDTIFERTKPIKKKYIARKINASEKTIVKFNSGSQLEIPSMAFADRAGNPVAGTVEIRYKELLSPIEMALEQMDMNYDSAGVTYLFASAGMCDIQAWQGDKPLELREGKSISASLVSFTNSPAYNLYYYDSTAQNWIFKGKSENTQDQNQNTQTSTIDENTSIAQEPILIEPVKPEKANTESPVIDITIKDKDRFPELAMFDNIQFQIAKDDKNYKPEDMTENWYEIQLTKNKKQNNYTLTLTGCTRSVTYTGTPVIDGKDYEQATKDYEIRYKEYLKQQKEKAKEQKNTKPKQLTVNDIAALGDLTDNEFFARQAFLLNYYDFMILQAKRDSLILKKDEKEKALIAKRMTIDINLRRDFDIDRLGVWNCDAPTLVDAPLAYFELTYMDKKIDNLNGVKLIYHSYNTYSECYGNKIKPLGINSFVGMMNDSIMFFTKPINMDNIKKDLNGNIKIPVKIFKGNNSDVSAVNKTILEQSL